MRTTRLLLFFLMILISYQSLSSELKIATYNIGMLNVANPVPFYKDRIAHLKECFLKTIKKENVDIFAIQEAWTRKSHEILKRVHKDYTFISIEGDAWIPLLEHKTGLGFLVKKSLNPKASFYNYKARESYTCGYGQICDRGILSLKIKLDKRFIYIFNTHLTPMYNLTAFRKNQVSEIIKKVEGHIKSDVESKVFILGDFNLSKNFGRYLKTDDGVESDWINNSKLYDLFFVDKKMTCKDTYEKNRDKYSFTQERETNKTAVASKSSGIAPSQRNDFILYCERKSEKKLGEVEVIENKLIFKDLIEDKMHLSDHYGVLTQILVK